MSESSVVRTPRPLTRAVRAAAAVVIAIGAGGVVAQFVPRYGALYVYAAALIGIAWLEGVLFGAIAAAAAAVTYALLFGRGWFSTRELLVALATSLLLPLLAIRRRPKTLPQPQVTPQADSEADALRVQLSDALAKLYESNQQRERLCEQYEQDNELMQRENEALRKRVEEERAAAGHLDETWSAKLQKIVAELASDHENDLGDAVAEREAARAEVRSLQMKMTSLQHAATKSAPPRRPLILVVHHDPAMRSMSRDNLDKNGFDILTAADGLEGLRLAVAHKPAVVVADASMPKMDGRELCQLIKSNPETSGVRVVLLTADERDEVPRELGPDELLRKPVKFDALQAALARLTRSE
jgi:CheY-like chemotaxis protein